MRKLSTSAAAAILLAVLFLFPASSQAASSIIPSLYSISKDYTTLVIKLVCTAHTDGNFDNKQILSGDIITAGKVLPVEYQNMGYSLFHAWAVNDATTYPSSGAVTITDETGQQLVGSTAGDTLTLSTTASGLAMLSASRGPAQRPVTNKLTISVSDTGSAANIFTLYLVLGL